MREDRYVWRRIANASMNLEIPLKVRLMPTNVPITQAELDGQWAQIKKPSRRVMIPSKSTQPA